MSRIEDGTTDVMSSLPIIAMCVVSVGILLVALSNAVSPGTPVDNLSEKCGSLSSAALDLLTSEADDGMRYLSPDWPSKLTALDPYPIFGSGYSSAIEIRIFENELVHAPLSGDVGSCHSVRSACHPILLMNGGLCIPGELIAMVGI